MTEQKRDNVIDKIKKLFALGTSANENESALAISKAQDLMLQHNLSDIDLIKETSDIIEIDFTLTSRFQTPFNVLAYHIGKAFFVKPILIKTHTGYHKSESKIRFIGEKSDIAVSTYVYSYIISLADKKSKEYFESIRYTKAKWSPLGAKKIKNDFMYGFVVSVSEKLKQIRADHDAKNKYEVEASNALMIIKNDLIENYIKSSLGKVKEGKSIKTNTNDKAFVAGQIEGQKAGIHKGISDNNKSKLMIGEY